MKLDTICALFESSDLPLTKLEVEIGLVRGTVNHWKHRGSKPAIDALEKIADYFNVTIDHLMGREAPIHHRLPDDQRAIVLSYAKFPDLHKGRVQGYVRALEEELALTTVG